MYTNADCTVYLHSKTGKTETYTRTPIEGVYWEDVRHSTFMKTGQKDACSVLVVIPMESLDEPLKFTQGKDLIVKGIVMDSIDCTDQKSMSESLAALKAAYEYLMVTSVDERLYGSEAVQHYELACK